MDLLGGTWCTGGEARRAPVGGTWCTGGSVLTRASPALDPCISCTGFATCTGARGALVNRGLRSYRLDRPLLLSTRTSPERSMPASEDLTARSLSPVNEASRVQLGKVSVEADQ